MAAETYTSGRIGEEIAALFLALKGYRILGRNLRSRRSEIDIVAEKSGCLVFAEVKLRGPGAVSSPLESVDHKKILHITRGVQYLLQSYGDSDCETIRLDVISVTWDENELTVEHVEDAFRVDGSGAW